MSHRIQVSVALAILLATSPFSSTLVAADPPSSVGPLMGLLKKGTLPPERSAAVAKMVCERGNEHDLAYIFSETISDTWPVELRRETLSWLRAAAANRKVHPAGDLAPLAGLIASEGDQDLRMEAIRLAGVWKTPDTVPALRTLAQDADAASPVRTAAIDALVAYGGKVASETVDQLLADDQPLAMRVRGIAALAGLDAGRAAAEAARVLQQ
ncbi:MAG: HEAT repeat domain-containing protein, partial [Planctomycetaceae bacterium]|nr:HEAT repeat domain-containing protein [Planctomycetaceae bacterium]